MSAQKTFAGGNYGGLRDEGHFIGEFLPAFRPSRQLKQPSLKYSASPRKLWSENTVICLFLMVYFVYVINSTCEVNVNGRLAQPAGWLPHAAL